MVKNRAAERSLPASQRGVAGTYALGGELRLEDPGWCSCLAQPALQIWAEADQPSLLVKQTVADTMDSEALRCYGVGLRSTVSTGGWADQAWLRFVAGRLGSALDRRHAVALHQVGPFPQRSPDSARRVASGQLPTWLRGIGASKGQAARHAVPRGLHVPDRVR